MRKAAYSNLKMLSENRRRNEHQARWGQCHREKKFKNWKTDSVHIKTKKKDYSDSRP